MRRKESIPCVLAIALTTGSTALASDWNRVRRVPGGSEVQVTLGGRTAPSRRIFVAADDTGLTVMNVTGLSGSARRVLVKLASDHPDQLLSDATYIEGPVQVDRAGVLVGGRLVVERSALLNRVARDDLQELRFAGPGGDYAKRGALIGLVAGATVAYKLGSSCDPSAAPAECHYYGMLLMPLGAGAGAAIGAIVGGYTKRPSSEVIYSVP